MLWDAADRSKVAQRCAIRADMPPPSQSIRLVVAATLFLAGIAQEAQADVDRLLTQRCRICYGD